jgi:hypothetical protein
LSDLETNLRRIVSIVGGTAYSGGTTTGLLPGALGRDNVKDSGWISNARLSEPYSYLVAQGTIRSVAASGTSDLILPNVGSLSDVVGVEYGLICGYTGGATFSGTLSLDICGTAMTTMTITNLAKDALLRQSIAGATWVPGSTDQTRLIRARLTNSSAVALSYLLVTVVLKAKHIA